MGVSRRCLEGRSELKSEVFRTVPTGSCPVSHPDTPPQRHPVSGRSERARKKNRVNFFLAAFKTPPIFLIISSSHNGSDNLISSRPAIRKTANANPHGGSRRCRKNHHSVQA